MNAVLWWLCQNTLAVALMIPFVLILARAFQTRPAVQHVLWLVLLIKLLLPPLVELPWPVESILTSGQSASVEPETPVTAIPPLPALEPIIVAPEMVELPMATPPQPPLQPTPLLTIAAIGDAIVAFWVVGGALAFSVQLRRIARHRTLVRAGTEAPRHLHNEIGRVAKQMGLRPLHAVIVPRITSPFVWCFGWLRLIWPETLLAERDVLRSRGMIAHELAHVRRRDHWIAWLELIAGLIWWWNPLFWFVRRRLRESAEWACDALAIDALPDERRAYAEMFLELSSSFKSGTPVPVLGMSTGAPSSFERRLTMILSERVSGKMSRRGFLLAAGLALILAPTWSLGQSGGSPKLPPPLTDFEKRLLQELRQREQAVSIHDARLKLQAAEADHALAVANWQKDRDPLEGIILDTIATTPGAENGECEAFLSARIYKSAYIRLRAQPGHDTFQIPAKDEKSKPVFVGRVLRIDEREIYFQAGQDVHKLTMYQHLADALRNKLDAKQLDAVGLTKSIDAEFAAKSGEEMQKRPDPVVAEQSKARWKAAEAHLKAAKSNLEKLLRENPDTQANNPQSRLNNELSKNQIAVTKTQFESLLRGDAKLTDELKGNIERIVEPQNTLDLTENRVNLFILKETPKRIQVGDESVAIYNQISPKEITWIGRATGSTVVNIWFADETGRETIHSYLVRVFPDPEARERLNRVYRSLELETNREFPISVVRLWPIGDKILVTGQAYDSSEATKIIRFVRAHAPNAKVKQPISVENTNAAARPAESDPGKDDTAQKQYLRPTGAIVNLLRVAGTSSRVDVPKAVPNRVDEQVQMDAVRRKAEQEQDAKMRSDADRARLQNLLNKGHSWAVDMLIKLRAEEQNLLSTQAPGHLDVVAKRQQIETLERELDKLQTNPDRRSLFIKQPLIKLHLELAQLQVSHGKDHPKVVAKLQEIAYLEAKLTEIAPEAESPPKSAKEAAHGVNASKDAGGSPADLLDPKANALHPPIPTLGLIIRAQTRTHQFAMDKSVEEARILDEIRASIQKLIERRVSDEYSKKWQVEIEKFQANKHSDADAARLLADQQREAKARVEAAMSLLQKALKQNMDAPSASDSVGQPGAAADMQQLIKLITDVVDPGHWYYVQQQKLAGSAKKDGNPIGDPKQEKDSNSSNPPAKALKGVVERVDSKDPSLVNDATKKKDAKGDDVVIRLKNASASETAKILNEAFNGPSEGNGNRRSDRIRVVADPATNSLLVKAAPLDLATVRNIIGRLDAGKNAPATRPGADARVLRLTNVQAKEIAKVLTELFAKEAGQGLTIVAEPMTNSLLVRGTVVEHDAVAAVVRSLDEPARGKANPARPNEKSIPDQTPGKKADSKRTMIERKLAQSMTLNFQDVPLYRVLSDLSIMSGLNIVADEAAMKVEKIRLEQPLRLKVEDIALDSALKLLLRQAKLTYVIRNEVLFIVPDSANPSTNASPDSRRSPKQGSEPR